ncbi:MAG: DNA-binding transcriptional regulator [Planctomycetaceae bacterium]|nr:DNA-binding transcriptional regulator [Planctomycetaceae bacterium]
MNSQRTPNPEIVVLVETSRSYARDILRGIMRYEMLHGPWNIYANPGGRQEQRLPKMSHRHVKGIIAHITSDQMIDGILEARLPTVSVFPWGDVPSIANQVRKYGEVRCDSAAIGRTAALYLHDRCFPHYGFVGELYDVDWSNMRRDAFVETVTQNGYSTHIYPTLPPSPLDWNLEQERLCEWIQSLPKPIGIFTAHDIRGRHVIDACHTLQIRIPDEVAVLGVDNDELFCESITPRLSSVALDCEKAGYESAKMLDELMRGSRKKKTAVFGPARVVSRRSSDFYHIDDPLVRKALGFIQSCYAEPIAVTDVVKATDVSRRLLEMRFKQEMGHSVLDEIKKRRLEKVKMFLLETDISLEKIAELCGFQSKNYLINVFRKEFGMTMGTFRNEHRTI